MGQIIPPNWRTTILHCLSDREPFFNSVLVFLARKRPLHGRYLTSLDRLSLRRWQRWLLVEPLSEVLTLVLGGLILAMAFAVSTIRAPLQEDWLKASSVTACLFDQAGLPIGRGTVDHGVSVPLGGFPDALIKAMLATENRDFYDQFAIDFAGALRAFLMITQNDRVHQVDSSITRQLVRSLVSNPKRSIEDTVKEILLAAWLEWNLTKDEALRLYLNCVNLGGDALGVDGAARFYFNKPARQVNLAEAARQGGLIQAPTSYAPHFELTAARARQRGAGQPGRKPGS